MKKKSDVKFNLGMEQVKEDPKIIFVRRVTVGILLFNVFRYILIAIQSQALECVLLAILCFGLALGIFFKKVWAKQVVVNVYRALFLIGLYFLIMNIIGKDVSSFFSLFYYAQNLKLTSGIMLKGIIIFLIETFGMVLMLDDKASIPKAIIAGVFCQIVIPLLFFLYLISLYSGFYVNLYDKYIRYDQALAIIQDNKTDYYFSDQYEYKMEAPGDWFFLSREDFAKYFGITLAPHVEIVLAKIFNYRIITIDVKAFKSFNPADAYAELEGFRFAMLAQEKSIIKDEQIPSDQNEIYNIVTFSDKKKEGEGIYRVISNRLVIDFLFSSQSKQEILAINEEIKTVIHTIKIY